MPDFIDVNGEKVEVTPLSGGINTPLDNVEEEIDDEQEEEVNDNFTGFDIESNNEEEDDGTDEQESGSEQETTDSKEKVTNDNQDEEGYDYKEIIEFKKSIGELPDDFELPEDFDNSEDSYRKIVDNYYKEREIQIEDSVYGAFRQLDEQHGGIISHLANGGSIEDFNKVEDDFESYKPDAINEVIAEKVLRKRYELAGYKRSTIEKKINKHKDLEDIVEEAKDELEYVQEFTKKKKQEMSSTIEKQKEMRRKEQEEVIKAEEQFVENYQNKVNEMNDFLGVKVDKRFKNKMINNANKVVKEINDNWGEYLPKLVALYNTGILNGKTDFIDKHYTTKSTRKVVKNIDKGRKSIRNSSMNQSSNTGKGRNDGVLQRYAKK